MRLESPKYDRPVHNETIGDPLDEWLYFLRFASTSTAEELTAPLADQEFTDATGVLEMIAKTPTQRMLYEARLKFQRDERARLTYAEQKGREEGEQIGRIRLLQQLLGMSESSREQLAQMDLSALEAMAADLQTQLRSRES